MGAVTSTPVASGQWISPVRVGFYDDNDKEICTLSYATHHDILSDANMQCVKTVINARKTADLALIWVSRKEGFVPHVAVAGALINTWKQESTELACLHRTFAELVLDFNFSDDLGEATRAVYQDAFTNSMMHLSNALNITIAAVRATWSHSKDPVDPRMVAYAEQLQTALQKRG